jgi:hypothetical protein
MSTRRSACSSGMSSLAVMRSGRSSLYLQTAGIDFGAGFCDTRASMTVQSGPTFLAGRLAKKSSCERGVEMEPILMSSSQYWGVDVCGGKLTLVYEREVLHSCTLFGWSPNNVSGSSYLLLTDGLHTAAGLGRVARCTICRKSIAGNSIASEEQSPVRPKCGEAMIQRLFGCGAAHPRRLLRVRTWCWCCNKAFNLHKCREESSSNHWFTHLIHRPSDLLEVAVCQSPEYHRNGVATTHQIPNSARNGTLW